MKLPVVSSFYRKLGAMSLSRYAAIGAALVVSMVLTRILDPEVFGAYRKIWLVYALVGPAFVNAMASTLYYRGKAGQEQTAIAVNVCLGLAYGLLTGLIGFMMAGYWASWLNIPELADGFRMFAPYMALAVFAGIAEPLFITINRKKWLVSYSFGYNTIEFCLIVIPFALGFSIPTIMLIMAAGPALRSLIVIGIATRFVKQWPDREMLKTEFAHSFRYAWGIFILTATSLAVVQTDKWVVGIFFESDSIYAIYEIGAKKIPFVIALTSAVSASLVAEYSDKIRLGSLGEVVAEAKKASGRLFMMLTPSLCFLFVYAEETLFILFGGYESSAPIFRIYLLTIFVQLVFPQSIILGAGRSDVNARYGLYELVFNLVLSIALVMWIGLIGPAISTLVAHVLYTTLLFYFCRKQFGISAKDLIPGREIGPLVWIMPVVLSVAVMFKYFLVMHWVGFVITGMLAAAAGMVYVSRMQASK